MTLANSTPSSTVFTTCPAAIGSPIFSIVCWNSRRSSAFLIVDGDVPINFTPDFSRYPLSTNSIARFNAACPPSVGRILSGFSFSMIFSMTEAVNGSIYTLSAISLSVMIVAGFEFTKTTSTPSS